jgi:hypothetical protein
MASFQLIILQNNTYPVKKRAACHDIRGELFILPDSPQNGPGQFRILDKKQPISNTKKKRQEMKIAGNPSVIMNIRMHG